MEENERLDRLKTAYDWLKSQRIVSTYTEIAKTLQQPNSSISTTFSGNPRYLTNRFLHRFACAFPINEQWLVSGDGEMIDFDRLQKNIGQREIPLVDLTVSFTGWDHLSQEPTPLRFTTNNVLYNVIFPNSDLYDFAIEVTDDYNTPVIPPDTLLHLRQCDASLLISSGQLGVFQVKNAQNYYNYIIGIPKLQKLESTNNEIIEISFFNPNKEPEYYPKTAIKRVWKVINYTVFLP